MARFIHPSTRPVEPGRTIGTPARYAFLTWTLFVGRRRAAMSALARKAEIKPGQNVLDVGCGDGLLTAVAADLVGSEGAAGGVDAAPEMVAWAQRRHPEARFVEASAEALPAPDAHFDTVLCSFVIHHLAPGTREIAFREMARVLRPGGQLLVAEVASPAGGVLGLFARLHGLDRMAAHAPALPPLMHAVGLETGVELSSGPFIRYALGRKPAS